MSLPVKPELRAQIEVFAEKWGPKESPAFQEFLYDLRLVVEAWGNDTLDRAVDLAIKAVQQS